MERSFNVQTTATRMALAASLLAVLLPASLPAQRRGRVVVARPKRTTVVVHRGHPIRRALPPAVVVRPARKTVVVGAPLRFLPPVIFAATVVPLPARELLAWQDTEVIQSDEDWVDVNFGVDDRGDALLMEIDGRAQLNFAEVSFENGDVQVVDFEEHTRPSGIYRVLDFRDGRRVMTVRLLARSNSDQTTLRMYLSR